MDIDTAVNKYCRGINARLPKDKIREAMKLSYEGLPLTSVAEKTNMHISTINTLKVKFRDRYGIKFPKVRKTRVVTEEKETIKRINHISANLNNARRLNTEEKEFIKNYDIEEIRQIVDTIDKFKAQTYRIEKIQKELKVNYEVARQLYHRYKREVSTWAV